MITASATGAASRTTDCDYISIVKRKVEQMGGNRPESIEPPTIPELEDALGESVSRCDLWKKNWRNRIYLVELATGETVVAKQIVLGDDAMVQYQYDQLGALTKLAVPHLRIPRALALIAPKRTLVMEFAHGRTLREMARHGKNVDHLISICELSGEILARIHLLWTREIAPMPIEALARDLAAAPWHLSSREKKTLSRALDALAPARVSMGQVCYDYQSKNLLYEEGDLTLIDPPDAPWHGIHLWDYSRFRGGLRRMLWRIFLREPWQRKRQAALRETLSAFKRGYIERFNKQHPEPVYFAAATRLLEIQHTAMSMATNQGKLNLAREHKPGFLGAMKAGLTTLPLLELEKRWLFQQLARELP
jgi:hypothetical protein